MLALTLSCPLQSDAFSFPGPTSVSWFTLSWCRSADCWEGRCEVGRYGGGRGEAAGTGGDYYCTVQKVVWPTKTRPSSRVELFCCFRC